MDAMYLNDFTSAYLSSVNKVGISEHFLTCMKKSPICPFFRHKSIQSKKKNCVLYITTLFILIAKSTPTFTRFVLLLFKETVLEYDPVMDHQGLIEIELFRQP